MQGQNRWHLKALMEGYLGLKSDSGFQDFNCGKLSMICDAIDCTGIGAIEKKKKVHSFGTVLRPP
jgi:hypothetical protein